MTTPTSTNSIDEPLSNEEKEEMKAMADKIADFLGYVVNPAKLSTIVIDMREMFCQGYINAKKKYNKQQSHDRKDIAPYASQEIL